MQQRRERKRARERIRHHSSGALLLFKFCEQRKHLQQMCVCFCANSGKLNFSDGTFRRICLLVIYCLLILIGQLQSKMHLLNSNELKKANVSFSFILTNFVFVSYSTTQRILPSIMRIFRFCFIFVHICSHSLSHLIWCGIFNFALFGIFNFVFSFARNT